MVITFQDLRELMEKQGNIINCDFEKEEKLIRSDKLSKYLKIPSVLKNSEYQVDFFSQIKGERIYINVKRIMGQIPFSMNEYLEDLVMGRVARKIVSEGGLKFIVKNGNYRVAFDYPKKLQRGKNEEIKNKEELEKKLCSVIDTQNRIKFLENEIELDLYERSKKY